MQRRDFGHALIGGISGFIFTGESHPANLKSIEKTRELRSDLVICGAGLGGCAAALAALRHGLIVILTEETDWIGGQLTSQGVPPDEHSWIETHGAPASYRHFREAVRTYYRQYYPLTEAAKKNPFLNPGNGAVSRLCHEPRTALAVLDQMLAPFLSNGQLTLLLLHKPFKAETNGDSISAIYCRHKGSGHEVILQATYFLDATELGDLLPISGAEFVTGTESKTETNELHAPDKGDPDNVQSFTMCFAMDYLKDSNEIIDQPENYHFWKNHIPPLTPPWSGNLLDLKYSNPKTLEPRELGFHPEGLDTGDKLNLWVYRRLISREQFVPGFFPGDISLVNWPQNDYMLGNLINQTEEEFDRIVHAAKQLSLSLFYWLQTEAPRPDGGIGWPGLRLRGDIMGSEDGMAKYPYVRESRRIKAEFTILEEHVGADNRKLVSGKDTAAEFWDSVGIGYYHIDLHPSNKGNNYIDFASLPFQIPLGSLLPVRLENLIPANKNIGTTHITNGCYRLHPVEWSIGEAAGLTATHAILTGQSPRAIRSRKDWFYPFQQWLRSQGIETAWPV